MMRHTYARRSVATWQASIAALLVAAAPSGSAQAAGGAYAVDDAEVGAPGACKVETWGSFADNSDRIGVLAPACVVNIFKPVELGVQIARSRADHVWATDGAVKGKVNILPVETGKIAVGLVGGVGFDLLAGDTANVFVLVPFTYQISEQFRINVNAGWLRETEERQNFFTWGAGFEWKPVEPVTLIAEVFGQAGHGQSDPRFQAGVRFTPRDWFDIDVIYGRNITGEDANWITLGLTVRFDVAARSLF
jgi:hypothetical protein